MANRPGVPSQRFNFSMIMHSLGTLEAKDMVFGMV